MSKLLIGIIQSGVTLFQYFSFRTECGEKQEHLTWVTGV